MWDEIIIFELQPLKFGNGYIFYKGCNHLSMLGLKLYYVSKSGHMDLSYSNRIYEVSVKINNLIY